MNKILDHLIALYGDEPGRNTLARLQPLISNYQSLISPQRSAISGQQSLTHRDALLITYGDQVRELDVPPLRTLGNFCAQHLAGLISTIHILPFYPYSSDDGFSVIDYRTVNPDLGDWDDVAHLSGEHKARLHFRLMFDAVINHISTQSAWFQAFLRDDPHYRDWFIVVPDGADVSRVIRPRTSPLLTSFQTPSGTKKVWTTFSADQVDLNYRNPDVLLEIIETVLFYLAHGASWIRLDAIAFLWKEFGTTCLHLPQTHRIIQLLRTIVDEIAPQTILITETNVPHADNVAYFGDGANEAHLVYNFALPPLVLHAFHTGDARTLSCWTSELKLPSKQVTFLNFLASHDGIGLNPARCILRDEEIDALVARALAHGGLVSYKTNPDGTASPYELNIVYYDALNDPNARESLDTQVDRFVCAHAIMLALVGVPAIYFHSLFGSRSWREGVTQTGHNRTINREKLERATLERELRDPSSRRARVFTRLVHLLRARAVHPAFDPYGEMRVLDLHPSVFALMRSGEVLCLHNVSAQSQRIELDVIGLLKTRTREVIDLCTQRRYTGSTLQLAPYQTLWLTSTR